MSPIIYRAFSQDKIPARGRFQADEVTTLLTRGFRLLSEDFSECLKARFQFLEASREFSRLFLREGHVVNKVQRGVVGCAGVGTISNRFRVATGSRDRSEHQPGRNFSEKELEVSSVRVLPRLGKVHDHVGIRYYAFLPGLVAPSINRGLRTTQRAYPKEHGSVCRWQWHSDVPPFIYGQGEATQPDTLDRVGSCQNSGQSASPAAEKSACCRPRTRTPYKSEKYYADHADFFKRTVGPFAKEAAEFHVAALRFLNTEADAGVSFALLAADSSNAKTRARNRRSARKAYDTILKYLGRAALSPKELEAVHQKIKRLRELLISLGEQF